jgi:hypothetical protein
MSEEQGIEDEGWRLHKKSGAFAQKGESAGPNIFADK